MFDGDGDGADSAMAAHRQAAARFDKQHSNIILFVRRRIEDTARHHVVASWLEHQTFPYPIVFFEEMDAFISDGFAL